MSKNLKWRKSWQEKLTDNKGLPRVEEITDKMSKRWGTGTVVIPAPRDVDKIMKKVPKGEGFSKVSGDIVRMDTVRTRVCRRQPPVIVCPWQGLASQQRQGSDALPSPTLLRGSVSLQDAALGRSWVFVAPVFLLLNLQD